MDSTPPANPCSAPSFSDLPEREPAFIAEPHFPLGSLVVLEGPRGAGKSWIAADLAAFVSREKEAFGKVLFIGSPGGLASTLKPRLQAAGADLSQIKVIEPSRVFSEEDGVRYLNLTLLSGFLSQESPSLLVIDPIDPYVNKKMGKFAEMLRDMAIEYECTILAVRRLPQTPTGRPAKTGPEDISFWADSVVLC
ncbi:MAG: AAA family ATPase, partial [Bdellovibrionota bacterium]